jgi:hypothetical protein
VSRSKYRVLGAEVTLVGCHVPNPAVTMLAVVPFDESLNPASRTTSIDKR